MKNLTLAIFMAIYFIGCSGLPEQKNVQSKTQDQGIVHKADYFAHNIIDSINNVTTDWLCYCVGYQI